MERCDFASVTMMIRSNLLEGTFDNQLEFAESLFSSYLKEHEVFFDTGLLNKWLNGLARLSPAIGQFYWKSSHHQQDLAVTLEDVILPCLSDSAIVVENVCHLHLHI